MIEERIGPITNTDRTMQINNTIPTTIRTMDKYLLKFETGSPAIRAHLLYETTAMANPAIAMYITKLGEKNPIRYNIRDTIGRINTAITKNLLNITNIIFAGFMLFVNNSMNYSYQIFFFTKPLSINKLLCLFFIRKADLFKISDSGF